LQIQLLYQLITEVIIIEQDKNGNMTNLDIGGVSLVNYQYSDNYGIEEQNTSETYDTIEPEESVAV
jgi:hypothetical protein